jgi:recombination protein RecT
MPARSADQSAVVAQPTADALAPIRDLLKRSATKIELTAARGVDPQQAIERTVLVISRNNDLLRCTPESIVRAVVQSLQYGLEPTGPIGGAHLVPYGTECVLIIDYRGLLEMARRSGDVRRARCRVVYEKDVLDYAYGLEERLVHVPHLQGDPGQPRFIYAVVDYADGDTEFLVWSKTQVEAIRQRSKAKNNGPWISDWEAMAMKTVLRQALKLARLSGDVREAIEEDQQREYGQTPTNGGEPDRALAALQNKAAAQIGLLGAEQAPAPDHPAGQPAEPSVPAPVSASSKVCGAGGGPKRRSDCIRPEGHAERSHQNDEGDLWPVVAPQTAEEAPAAVDATPAPVVATAAESDGQAQPAVVAPDQPAELPDDLAARSAAQARTWQRGRAKKDA